MDVAAPQLNLDQSMFLRPKLLPMFNMNTTVNMNMIKMEIIMHACVDSLLLSVSAARMKMTLLSTSVYLMNMV